MATTRNDNEQPAGRDDNGLSWGPLDTGADVVDIAPGVHLNLPLVVTATSDTATWTMHVDMVETRLGCTRLEVTRADDGPFVSTETLRGFALAREVYRVVKAHLWEPVPVGEPSQGAPKVDLLAGGPTDAALEYVATVYRLAEVCALKPTQAVEELGLRRRTAERWIQTARKKGML
jgi:hypothetical protein